MRAEAARRRAEELLAGTRPERAERVERPSSEVWEWVAEGRWAQWTADVDLLAAHLGMEEGPAELDAHGLTQALLRVIRENHSGPA